MKLHVHVLEARNLAARDQNGLSDPFVRLQLGNTKTKSAVILKNLNPVWHEEFFFSVVGSDEELLVTVWDEDRFLNDFLGQVKIPVSEILTAEKQTITRKWYTLQKRSEKSKILITGEILLSLSLFGRDSATGRRPQRFVSEERHSVSEDGTYTLSPTSSIDMNDCLTDTSGLVDVPGSPSLRATWPGAAQWNHDEDLSKEQNKVPKSLADRFTAVFNKKCKTGMDGASKHGVEGSTSSTPKFSDSAHVESPDRFPEVAEDCSDDEIDTLASSFFDDDGKSMEPSVDDFPPPLASGVVLDQRYGTSAKSLSALICKAGSPFIQELLTCLKTTEYSEEPWKRANNGCIERVVSYMKAATKIIKAVKASESHTCRRLDDRGFILDISCSTPDVPYGSNFMVKLQFCILAGQDLPSQEKTCRLQVSWTLHFLHSTMMKGMIENGARAGIKETYELYREVLSRYAKPIYEGPPGRELVPEAKREEETPLSDWELVKGYFGKLHVLMAILSLTAVFLHIGFASPKASATLIRWGFDLPDSLSEFLFSAIVVLQVEKVVKMVHQFLQARYWQSGDHGVKAQGDGWLMTVTLIEGENLSPTEECSFSNPYAVFTCSGKRRTSSVKLRTLNPRWREVFEFDATEDPPSTMDVEVFDYDGPFSDAESLGHAEINFLKQSPEDLADFWISLSGKCARTHGSRLHLRVFLTNTKQSDALPEYLERVQKEGIKVVKRSAQKNGSFQKLFALPAEEFLINDFACAIKKKILIQGRLFLSPRMLGFYSNLFGIKTKFQFIWEDIDDIVETPVAINPCIVMFLRKGRGLDARNGMRGIDAHGRAKFYFCSFVKPVTAFRTITALWKNRKLSLEQQLELCANVEAEDQTCTDSQRSADDADTFTGMEEANMVNVCAFDIPLTMDSAMSLFEKGRLEEVVAEKMGYINFVSTPWERLEGQNNVQRRQVSYHLNRQISQFGSKVSCIQQKTMLDNMKLYILDEVLTLHDVPFGDHFQVQVRRDIETTSINPPKSSVKAYVGVSWHKNTEFKKKITKNVQDHMAKEIREAMNVSVKEVKALVKDMRNSANGS